MSDAKALSKKEVQQVVSLLDKRSCRDLAEEIKEKIAGLPLEQRVSELNRVREILHSASPFKDEPVDCVIWYKCDEVQANDYNPNSVAPPEMELLRHSIIQDGYTQPIVGFPDNDVVTVVDGFHRNRVGKECEDVHKRVHGYLPVAAIKADRQDRNDRIASTIRHNRARGKHKVDAMSDIVVELKRRNWKTERICRELGMDEDEVLRLCQITGLSELFSDRDFSEAWDVASNTTELDAEILGDELDEDDEFRKVPSAQEGRLFHTWENWECYKAGFYATTVPGKTREQCETEYADFLRDLDAFRLAAYSVVDEWKNSCEHYLTNLAMNRIAWIGQASAAYALALPSVYRSGFSLLTADEQEAANNVALDAINRWLIARGEVEISMDEAMASRQADLY